VTVTAVDDSNIEGAHSDTITHQSTSANSNYNNISISSVAVSITDNDVVSVVGSSGGGSIYAIPPKLVDGEVFLINEGAKQTMERTVNLKIKAENAIQMAVSEDVSFSNIGYENYQSEKVFTLSEGFGLKNVFVKLRSAQGGELMMVQSIDYVASNDSKMVVDETGKVATSTELSPAISDLISALAKNLTRFLSFGSVGDDVSALQKILREYKYFIFSRITKYFGPITQNALKNYQKDNDLKPTGNLDIATREKIKGEKEVVKLNVDKYEFTGYLTLGSHGEAVKARQMILKDLGYFDYTQVSGMYGPITEAAVIKFQKDHGITPATGSIGPKTREILNSLD